MARFINPGSGASIPGPAGPAGPAGPQGPAGEVGAETTSYVSVWSGTGLAYTGNPVNAYYAKVGNIVQVQIDVELDNVTNFGSGQYSLTLPFNSSFHTDCYGGSIHNTGATTEHYSIKGHLSPSSNSMTLWYIAGSSQDQPFKHNAPINLTTADKFHMSFSYICE